MTNYQRGVRLEREVVKIFKDAGWEAIRTAGSHSPFDVILVKYTDNFTSNKKLDRKVCFVSFVQCKVENVDKEKKDEVKSSNSLL